MNLALALALALSSIGAAAPVQDPAVRDVSELLRPICEEHELPALAGAVVSGGRTAAVGAVGHRAKGSEKEVATSDRFHLGSCTKSMTATLVATFVEEGKLAWTTTVGETFRDLGKSMDPAWKDVTLEQLLWHRAGAPEDLREGGLWSRLFKRKGKPTEQRMDLVRGVLAHPPVSEPGTKFLYANAGYAIAGAMVERTAKEPWEDLMRERIFEPLGMTSAGFGAPGTKGKLDEPLGHDAGGNPVEIGPRDDNPPAIGPAGTAHATLGDWGKYVAMHLQGDRLLRPETFAKLHEPAAGAGNRYAMGWVVLDRDWGGGRVLMHNGSNTMWYCVAWMAPEKGFAVLAATNQGGPKAAKACDDAASALIRETVKDAGPAKRDGGR